jgi:hypothetical protein
VRKLVAIVFVLALLGASTQCVADCFTQPTVPPCHQHSKSKDSAPEHCKQAQPATDIQAVFPAAVETPAPAEVAFELFTPQTAAPGNIRSSFSVLRL